MKIYTGFLFCLVLLIRHICPLSVFDNLVPANPFNVSFDSNYFKTRAESGLELIEWARNLDNPDSLLIENLMPYIKYRHALNSNLMFEIMVQDRFNKYKYRTRKNIEDGVAKLKADFKNNEKEIQLKAGYSYNNKIFASMTLGGRINEFARHLDYSISAQWNSKHFIPFVQYSNDFPGIFMDYSIGTYLSNNLFDYKSIFNRKSLSAGCGFNYSQMQKPIIFNIICQNLSPQNILHREDSLLLLYDLRALFLKIPFTCNSWAHAGYFGGFDFNSLTSLYYLNVSRKGYSTVFSGLPFGGPGAFALYKLEKPLFKKLVLGLEKGYGQFIQAPFNNLRVNAAKYEVVSDANYRLNMGSRFKAVLAGINADLKLGSSHKLAQGIRFIRFYPFYKIDSKKTSFGILFGGETTYDTLENKMIHGDFLYYSVNWKVRKNKFELNLQLDQGIPLGGKYKGEAAAPTKPKAKAKGDNVIGLERAVLNIGYFIK
ncbi:MAG: hypothetical protein ABIA63_00350 [bacterium]